MKKIYSKPSIVFESFMMSSSVANTCEDKLLSETACYYEVGWDKFYAVGIDGSECTADDVDCYHVAVRNPSIFGS